MVIGQDTSVAELEQQLRELEQQLREMNLRNVALERDLEAFHQGRKFGLYWNEYPDEAQIEARTRLPLLVERPEHRVGTGERPHLLIEGDNYHALLALRQTHFGKIDAIYIDPPYNKDADVTYNDERPHSSWLSFMAPRLRLAWDLLSDSGVMFISIDDTEFGNLQLLLRQLFPVTGYKGDKKTGGAPDPFVGVFVWKKRTGSSDASGRYLTADHDYVICYAKPGFSFAGRPHDYAGYTNFDEGSDDPWMSQILSKSHNRIQRKNAYYPIQNPETGTWYPCNPDAVWRFASRNRIVPGQKLRKGETMEDLIARGKVIFPLSERTVQYESMEDLLTAIANGSAPKNLRDTLPDLDFWVGKVMGYGTPSYKRHKSELRRLTKVVSTWIRLPKEKDDKERTNFVSGMNGDGTKSLNAQLPGHGFPFPKPPQLIESLLRHSVGDDALILDFFAGSGTTAAAVLQLNEEDGGTRRFILATNNEVEQKKQAELRKTGFTPGDPEWEAEGICAKVTKPRMRALLETGWRGRDRATVEPYGGALRYFAVAPMVERSDSLDDMAEEIRRPGVALLRVAEDCYDLIEKTDAYELYGSDERVLGILHYPLAQDELIAALRRHGGQRQIVLYVFSFSGDVDAGPFRQAFGEQVVLRSMPPEMIRAYQDVLDSHLAGAWR